MMWLHLNYLTVFDSPLGLKNRPHAEAEYRSPRLIWLDHNTAQGDRQTTAPAKCWLPVFDDAANSQLVSNMTLSGSLSENYLESINSVATAIRRGYLYGYVEHLENAFGSGDAG